MAYGMKGGTSANAGRRGRVYEVCLPDGTVARKRSYQVDDECAYAGVYRRPDGRWDVAGIVAEVWRDGAVLRPIHPGYAPNRSQIAVPAIG